MVVCGWSHSGKLRVSSCGEGRDKQMIMVDDNNNRRCIDPLCGGVGNVTQLCDKPCKAFFHTLPMMHE